MFTPASLTYLRQLRRNNRRDWFEANRERYEQHIRLPMRELVDEMDVRLATLAPEMVGDLKRSIFRIHRDVRFSADKSPYKTHAACWFFHRGAGRGVGEHAHGAAGFYFHLEPGASLVAGGYWMPPRDALQRIRERIIDDRKGFERATRGRALARRFGALSEEAMLVRAPRGFAADHPAGRWLRYRSFTVSRPLTDDEALRATLPRTLERDFALILPMVRWLNTAVGYGPAQAR